MSSLPEMLDRAFAQGAEEVVLRVSRYGDDGKAAAWQAVVKPRDCTQPIMAGVRGTPVAALTAALDASPAPATPGLFD